MKIKILVGISLFIFFVSVTSILTASMVVRNKGQVIASATQRELLTAEVVVKHNNRNDCWLIISGKVYNLTDYLVQHPGGVSAVTSYCGRGESHSGMTKALLEDLLIGILETNMIVKRSFRLA
ncbi:hypothetical protein A2379_04625 [Candidatus Amesbacteria bacterium RIFOXYB1_FULL_47_13]|nr:MAG: hypothetical protein A2379_04625 [Candidatus Amesbacteria bacterium RIFOXYB1_FULL_47_13]HBC72764.1 hypothetical protein [Candidatus Amesbacteria bacterium]